MSDHTPGPWHLRTSVAVVAEKPKKHGGTRSICSTRPAMRTREAIGEAQANARLIAAAPDMLNELRDILEFATSERSALREQEIASIRAVIAKAQGFE